MNNKHSLILLAMLLFAYGAAAQTIIKGKVIDAATGDPIPFANVYLQGTQTGSTTDFNGFYEIQTSLQADSIIVSCMGYIEMRKPVTNGISQVIDFQLSEEVINLREVVFMAGENPAFEILRKVIDNKKYNDKRRLDAYQYESYNKIEIDVDNISDALRESRLMRQIDQVMDSIDAIAGEDGKPILPLFISESISHYYFRSSPKLQHEKILKTRMNGLGIEDGTLVAQFVGSSFQEYNFYQNWLNIFEKEFVSPIADGWKLYYEYDLSDSSMVGDTFCYRLDFFPKREQDLAFTGTMWITKEGYALKQIDATISEAANLNFIEKIKIQQELEPTEAGAWIPLKTRVLIDMGELHKKMSGILAKFYSSNKDIVVNKPQEAKFYEDQLEVVEGFSADDDSEYWEEKRHEPLTTIEKNVYAMIDTLNSIPMIRSYTTLMKVLVTGYKKVGKIDVGPIMSTYANNNIEGHRFQLGGRTNINFSRSWIFGGHVAFGTTDKEFKYNAYTQFISDRKSWTTFRVSYSKDIDLVGLNADDLSENYIFLAATRFGDLRRPYSFQRADFQVQRDLFKGYRQTVLVRRGSFDPLFPFAYKVNNEHDSPLRSHFDFFEVSVESRYARDEIIVVNDNDRLSMGTLKWPVVTLRYTAGIRDMLGGDFDYHKARITISDYLKMGFVGTSSFKVTAEKIFGTLPFPLLEAHVGNESLFYTTAAFNLMNYSEFASDRYVSVRYNHHFQGFILNRIPLMKKLKWRLLATGNILYGDLSQKNKDIISDITEGGVPVEQTFSLGQEPYVEVGYGIENIFKIGRIDFLHRLSHLDKPDVNKFGVKISFQFIL